jgi:hypothetical protein
LYIHDSWDGNLDSIGGPDIWTIQIDDLTKDPEETNNAFVTSFTNNSCEINSCIYQSYPDNYPSVRSPRSGFINTELPGLCQYQDLPYGSNLYKIEKVFDHKGKSLVVRISDRLTQTNSNNPICDESWSIDNINIWIIN